MAGWRWAHILQIAILVRKPISLTSAKVQQTSLQDAQIGLNLYGQSHHLQKIKEDQEAGEEHQEEALSEEEVEEDTLEEGEATKEDSQPGDSVCSVVVTCVHVLCYMSVWSICKNKQTYICVNSQWCM